MRLWMFGGAYTFFDPEIGWEASMTVVGGVYDRWLTFNFENPDTDNRSGTSVHLDWAVSRFLSEHLHLGLVGFAYKQLSDDSGGLSDQLGGFRSETFGVGPQIGFTFDADGRPVYANLQGYWEFAVENRTKGGGAFLSLAAPL